MPETDNQNDNAVAIESQVSHVSVKLPPLWKNRIKIWFIQVESNFELAKITKDVTKYNYLIAAIDPETLAAVSDILLEPPATDKYDTLKKRLIAEFSDSTNEQIRRLISEMHLGDDKPSHLLRKMRELGGRSITDDFLKTLWLQRLPSEMQAILSISSESLDKLAEMADKISEVRATPSNSGVFAVQQTLKQDKYHNNNSFSSLNEIQELKNEIAALSKQVERMSRGANKPHYRRSSSRNRFPSRSRSTERDGEYCFYHSRFGKKAHKCREPCSFPKTTGQENL
nr:uncharacterized protein LOC122271232 [Parasteatoda tepidariorum]